MAKNNGNTFFSTNSKGNTFDTMQQNNRMLVLRLIKEAGAISRKALSQATNLNSSTITLIINELLETGLVCESGLIEGENGRRVKSVKLNDSLFSCIIVTITTDYFSLALFDINSHCLEAMKVSLNIFSDIVYTLAQIKENIENFIRISEQRNLKIIGLAFALQGPFQFRDAECIMYNNSNYYIDIVHYFKTAFGYPIIYDTTSNYAIYRYTCLREYNYLQNRLAIYLGVNYAVDISVSYNRAILKGMTSTPGALGLMPITDTSGKDVPIASIISAGAIEERARSIIMYHPESSLFSKDSIHIRVLILAFYDGDSVALQIFSEVALALGKMIKNLTYSLHPHLILIAGEIPNNQTFQQMIIDASIIYPSKYSGNIPVATPEIQVIQEEQKLSNDPSMIGASMKLFNNTLKSPKILHPALS